LAVLGFSDIGKIVRWRPEIVVEETTDEDNPDKPVTRVLQSRVLVIDSETLPPEARLAVVEVSQSASGLRVKMHDKHGPLVSIGKHLGMFTDKVEQNCHPALGGIYRRCQFREPGLQPWRFPLGEGDVDFAGQALIISRLHQIDRLSILLPGLASLHATSNSSRKKFDARL
jgi:hypothetical protein